MGSLRIDALSRSTYGCDRFRGSRRGEAGRRQERLAAALLAQPEYGKAGQAQHPAGRRWRWFAGNCGGHCPGGFCLA